MSNGKGQGRSASTSKGSKRSAPINAKAVQDTTVRKTQVGAKTPIRTAPPDRRAYTGPPSSKSLGESVSEGVTRVVRATPVIGQIVGKLDEVTRNMGRRK